MNILSKIRLFFFQAKHSALTGLNEKSIASDPFIQFGIWYREAHGMNIPFPEAMTLSTVSADWKPSARVVLLRGYDEKGFIFYTNYSSRKGREISQNKNASLNFFWRELNRQVRIEGELEKVPVELSDKYFSGRPRGSQIGAWASDQSSVIESRDFLVMKEKKFKNEFKEKDIPRPSHWGGYRLKPQKIEFWQARLNRLHDRILYTLKEDGNWEMQRLAP